MLLHILRSSPTHISERLSRAGIDSDYRENKWVVPKVQKLLQLRSHTFALLSCPIFSKRLPTLEKTPTQWLGYAVELAFGLADSLLDESNERDRMYIQVAPDPRGRYGNFPSDISFNTLKLCAEGVFSLSTNNRNAEHVTTLIFERQTEDPSPHEMLLERLLCSSFITHLELTQGGSLSTASSSPLPLCNLPDSDGSYVW